MLGCPKVDAVATCGVTSADYRGVILSLDLPYLRLLLEPKMLLLLFSAWAHCLLMPLNFSAELEQSVSNT